jgi:hypothetical protein
MAAAIDRLPGPTRALAAMLLLAAVPLLFANRVAADESVFLAGVLAVAGLAGLVSRDTARLRRVLEGVSVLALLLGGAEWMVRRENAIASRAYVDRTMHFVPDPLLKYEMMPGVPCGGGEERFTNDHGMVDGPRTIEKPPATLRIACLGDSVGGDGSLVNACAALESILNEGRGTGQARSVQVLNFSVPGYNTMQEARALEVKALPFDPDAVVLLYVMNDPFPDLAITHDLPGHLKFEHLLFTGARLAAGKVAGSVVDPFAGMIEGLYEQPRSWDGVVVAGFDRIRAVADARRLPVVVAVFPIFVARLPAAYDDAYGKVTREAERHGFVGVNLSEAAFRGVPLESLLKPSRDMIHPNAFAHHLAAAAIARAMLERYPELAR